MDHARWTSHFERNRLDRPEPDWVAPVGLNPECIPPLVRTLAQFQLGDGGGPCSLIARDAGRFQDATPEVRRLVDAWFREEAEHSRLLGCALERFGGRPIQSHWSFTAFCAVRRWLGVRFELQVLLLTELVSTAYYRLLRRHVPDAAIDGMCALILRDEAGHVEFHRDRLTRSGIRPCTLAGALWQFQFLLCGYAAATVLWSSHGRCLAPFGATTREFYGEARSLLTGFLERLVVRSRRLGRRADAPEHLPPAAPARP